MHTQLSGEIHAYSPQWRKAFNAEAWEVLQSGLQGCAAESRLPAPSVLD